MISNPKNGWCSFNFGGVDYEIDDYVNEKSVIESLVNALYNSVINHDKVGVELLSGDGKSVILAEGVEDSWFVVRNNYNSSLPNGGFEVTPISDKPICDVIEELIVDLETYFKEWEEGLCLKNGYVALCIQALRQAQTIKRERDARYERLMAESMRNTEQEVKRKKKVKDEYQSYLDWEQTIRGQKMISKSRSIEWGKRNFIVSGENTFKLGDFEFTFCYLGYSSASLIRLFEERVLKRRRLNFFLNGDGPMFYFVETEKSRYGIIKESSNIPYQCIDFSAFSLEKMARQLVVDASLDVYGFCYCSFGGCSIDCEQELRGKIGMLKRAINRRWPKRRAHQSDDEWNMDQLLCFNEMLISKK